MAVAVLVVAVVVVAVVVAAAAWRVPAADQALVVTGWRPRVVRRRGTFVWPVLERATRVGLDLSEQATDVDLVAAEGIAFGVGLVCWWRVGDEDPAVVEAARHFSRRSDGAARHVGGSVAARARAAIGALPAAALLDGGVEAGLASGVRAGVAGDLEPLGLVVVSLAVTRIDDVSGYLADLGRPQRARAVSDARIAAAGAATAEAAAGAAAEATTAAAGAAPGAATGPAGAGVTGAGARFSRPAS
jgi:uncharacterized membrane protein YqiK